MEAYRVEITLSFVAVYMVFCVVVGLWAMRRKGKGLVPAG